MNTKRNAKGEGSFKVNKNGSVTHRKSVGYKANGNRKVLTVTAANKTSCIKKMREKIAQWEKWNQKEKVTPDKTVRDLCQLHLRYQIEQEELKAKSIDRRECTIERYIGDYPLGKMQIQAVKVANIEEHVMNLIREKRLSVSSIEKVVDVLNAAFNWAVARGEVELNPVITIKQTLVRRIQKMKRRTANEADVEVLSIEEQRRFEQEAVKVEEKTGKLRYSAGLYGLLLLYTGMRCGEMLALCWRDVDLEQGYLTIEKSRSMAKNREKKMVTDRNYVPVEGTTKNEKARKIKLTDEALNILRQIKKVEGEADENELIVKTRTGSPNTATNLEHRMATIFKNAGLEKSGLHIFRRTFATRMYENGARVKEIAAYIGDLESTTERYYIAVRRKIKNGNEINQIVMVPARLNPNER